jgi:hypothetical protein
MTPKQRAEEIYKVLEHGDDTHRQWLYDIIVPLIEYTVVEAEKDVLERLASFCDAQRGYVGMGCYTDIAEFIRHYAAGERKNDIFN